LFRRVRGRSAASSGPARIEARIEARSGRRPRLRRTLIPLLVVAIGACSPSGELRRETEEATEQRGQTLLPDVGARPKMAVMSVTSARRAALRNASLVTSIVNGLPPSVRYLVLTNDLAAFTVLRSDDPEQVRFVELPGESPITIWPQDPFLVLESDTKSGQPTLLRSRGFERAEDRLMAAAVAEAGGLELRDSELYFEGGNLVSDRRRVLIGANTIRYNALELGTSEGEVVLRFELELGRPVLVLGPVPQPVSHIDMAVTPLGEGRVAVADPARGAAIAEGQLEEDPAAVEAFERSCEEEFFGHPDIRQIASGAGVVERPAVVGRTRAMIERSRRRAPALDGVSDALARAGYEVERIPFLFGGPQLRSESEVPSEPLRPDYPMLTYNNVIVEQDVEGPIVYLPQYGWPAMDSAAARAWSAIGFDPRPIEGLTVSAMYGGALRCSVKVLER
jgi:hypothetical protein